MANNRINRYVGAIAFGTLLATVSGCTDTWDDHYNSDGTAAGTTATLWDVISSNKELSKFTEIVRNAYYYKDNEHPVTTYSFEDILNGGQVNTVWVPDNNALSQAEFDYWMKMLAESKANPNSNAGFNVQQQFLGNHIALWRHNISEPGIDTVKMVNGKNLIFNKTARTLEGVSLGDYNIPTANGVLHILKGIAPFRYNLYEHLKYGDTKAKKFSDYVVGQDTTYFSQDLSIEGLPDENGRPTYVDSVYFTSNMLFEAKHWNLEKSGEKWQMLRNGFAARINAEDSAFVMLMPTDNAWDATYEKLKSAYVYSPVYEDKTKGDENVTVRKWRVFLDITGLCCPCKAFVRRRSAIHFHVSGITARRHVGDDVNLLEGDLNRLSSFCGRKHCQRLRVAGIRRGDVCISFEVIERNYFIGTHSDNLFAEL